MADAAQSDGDLIVASDTEGNGVGDIVFKTGQVERGRIRADGSGTGVFGGSIPALGTYLPQGWGRYWKAARNAASSTPATVAFVGDSITQGCWASNILTKSYVGLLTASLQASYGDGGSGFFSAARSTLFATAGFNYSTPDQAVALTGTWTAAAAAEGPGDAALTTIVSGSTLTAQVRGTKATVYFIGKSTTWGAFTWTVDGVSQGSVNTGGQTGNGIFSVTVSGLSAGNHTIVITASDTNSIFICGVSGENTTGLIVNRFGKFGSQTGDWTTTATFGRASLWSGGNPYPADLLVYALGVNDAHNSVAVSTVVGNIAGHIRDVLANTGGRVGATDVLFLVQNVGKYEAATRNSFMAQYSAGLAGLAQTFGAAIIDLNATVGVNYAFGTALNYWGDDTSSGLAGSSQVHPGDAGHAKIAATLLPFLTAA